MYNETFTYLGFDLQMTSLNAIESIGISYIWIHIQNNPNKWFIKEVKCRWYNVTAKGYNAII